MGKAKNMSIMFVRATEIWRDAVDTDRIRVTLEKCIAGEIDLTPAQLRSAELLLARTVPTLSSVEHSGSIEQRTDRERTDAELIEYIRNNAPRADVARIEQARDRQKRIALVHSVHDSEVETGEDSPRYQ